MDVVISSTVQYVGDVEKQVQVQRVLVPGSVVESWTVLGEDGRPVGPVDRFLAHLSAVERSPNTVKAYAHDLKDYWSFLAARDLDWREVRLEDVRHPFCGIESHVRAIALPPVAGAVEQIFHFVLAARVQPERGQRHGEHSVLDVVGIDVVEVELVDAAGIFADRLLPNMLAEQAFVSAGDAAQLRQPALSVADPLFFTTFLGYRLELAGEADRKAVVGRFLELCDEISALFADDFEDGSTCDWSDAQPAPCP